MQLFYDGFSGRCGKCLIFRIFSKNSIEENLKNWFQSKKNDRKIEKN